ncbi:hypothetical protein JMN32_23135 [Fulvivirga sp. 29W222]|uniref:Uncharacterized protein n=1 Tax=Fulvivirga marina TaxID=2494733 RepID=A0A937KGI3_9BACT|nr:hypothetical protein [Fulvivirga marina]MBL6449223.1 hypothetical protein [Fulvivirga marina]
MLEVLTVLTLGKTISKIARKKGLKPWKYVIILLILLFGFEVSGAMVGAILYGQSPLVYVLAILGAAFGGFLSYQIVKFATPVSSYSSEDVLDTHLRG